MIEVTRLNGKTFWINPHQIETIESTPDTIIRLLSERKYIVTESCEEIFKKIVVYRRQIGLIGNEHGENPEF